MADKKEDTSLAMIAGHYKVTGNWYRTLCVEGDRIVVKGIKEMGEIPILFKFGDFGEADPKICEMTGQSFYNMQLSYTTFQEFKELGVISKDGVKIVTKNIMGIGEMEWITEEEAAAWMDDGDPIVAPPAPYKIQPENPGKFVWLSGPPGVGKSTSAQLLARNHGYVYYEGDCFGGIKNPYIPVDVEDPSLAQVNQRPLKGEGVERRKEAHGRVMQEWGSFMKGDFDKEVFEEFYLLLCDDIQRERGRIGGDWAVAFPIITRAFRDFIRSTLGPDLVFVVLDMEQADQEERIRIRHQGDQTIMQMMTAMNPLYEHASEDEENVLDVKVTPDMSPEEVTRKILDILK